MPITDPDRYGPDPAEWRPEYDEWAAKYLRQSVAGTPVVTTSTPALTEPSWIKRAYLEGQPKPGDIVAFGLDGIKCGRRSDYGHVEIARGMRALRYALRNPRRSFLARLADSVRGRK